MMWEWIFFYTKLQLFDRLFPATCAFFLDGRSKMLPAVARTRECWERIRLPFGHPDGMNRPGEGRFGITFQRCTNTRCKSWRYLDSPISWRRIFTSRRGVCMTSDLRRARG
jgi:hypothetical protein